MIIASVTAPRGVLFSVSRSFVVDRHADANVAARAWCRSRRGKPGSNSGSWPRVAHAGR